MGIPVTVIYPLDPLGPKVGGSVTFIKGFVRHAPTEFDLRFIGVSADGALRKPRQWSTQSIDGREFAFHPLFVEDREDRRRHVPLSLRFVMALGRDGVPDDGSVLVHNRLETVASPATRRHANVVIVHNDIQAQIRSRSSEVLWSRVPQLYFLLERRLFGRVDHVYTVSSRTLADYQRRYPLSDPPVDFLPTWADPNQFSPRSEPRASLRGRLAADGLRANPLAPWILFSGRLQEQKAPDRLIDAFAAIHASRPDSQLILAGDGNLRGETEARIARLGLATSVHLLGAIPQDRLLMHYRAADALILASHFEGMPMCVLEALACGLPVATTDVGEVRRVVVPGVTGEIADEANATALAQCVMRILAHPLLYARERCIGAVAPFSPARVLQPLYARVAVLAEATASGAAR